MERCPCCETMMMYQMPDSDRPLRLICPTCPYLSPIRTQVDLNTYAYPENKRIDPIAVTCPDCDFSTAGFSRVQTGDPMILLCACTTCGRVWTVT